MSTYSMYIICICQFIRIFRSWKIYEIYVDNVFFTQNCVRIKCKCTYNLNKRRNIDIWKITNSTYILTTKSTDILLLCVNVRMFKKNVKMTDSTYIMLRTYTWIWPCAYILSTFCTYILRKCTPPCMSM